MEWGTTEGGAARAVAECSRDTFKALTKCWSDVSYGLSGSGRGGNAVLILLSFRCSLSKSCRPRAPVAVVDASSDADHAVHTGIIRCCHLDAAGAAETADDLD